MIPIAVQAMRFAFRAHAGQKRKYLGNPYTDHLAEVAGLVATVDGRPETVAVAWLHDTVEDCGVILNDLTLQFGPDIADGVDWLTDREQGKNRAERKQKAADRLSKAPGWMQTIKLADLISNTNSIVMHDPKFAAVYLAEKETLLRVMQSGNRHLFEVAKAQIRAGLEHLDRLADAA